MNSNPHSRNNVATAFFAAAILGVAATALLVGVAPAQADTRHFTDPAGDMTSGQQIHPGDIETVTVSHETRLRVTVHHHDLQPDAQIGASLFIDTNPDRPGPELVLTAGLSEGTDYTLNKAQEWKPVGNPLTCFHRLGLNYTMDASTFVLGRACLGDIHTVRVALRVSGPSAQSVDWLGGRRQFTPRHLAMTHLSYPAGEPLRWHRPQHPRDTRAVDTMANANQTASS